ncbi:GIY-YIG nuclease family protein [Aliivibrio fischeri]|uniref:GIY-YIG nuclease family protein n=2 Tax=Aliivibrio fischeri TaxID=668 RepID=UPI00191150E7|nr:GIY-YIG nuclease family protein [Aliivibrio fischeri]
MPATKISKARMILLNDILNLDNLDNVKIRFNLMFSDNWNPSEIYRMRDFSTLLNGHYHNYSRNRSYREGQITVGFLKIEDDKFLLFHVGQVTKDLNVFDGVGYEYESIPEYEKYCGRLVVKFQNSSQNMVRRAVSVIDDISVHEILSDDFSNDKFPGYDNVRLSWGEMRSVLQKDTWKTALENQKAVYLITDKKSGKMYVGSASGEQMLLGRWKSYARNGHGGNVELRQLTFDYIQNNFEYSILEIFKSTTDSSLIIERESWWKQTLKSRQFGYNSN